MKLVFIGADHEVTGSCHYIETGSTNLIVDFGMEQGINTYVNADLPVKPEELQYVLITHAHIDHTGMLPLLYAKGFRGHIITTPATRELCQIMLRDSAHIQEAEAEWRNRKAKRAGKSLVEPIFTLEDALGVLGLFESIDYGEKYELTNDIVIRFIDVGHLLGSASIEMWIKEDKIQRKIVFSGDIGNFNKPLIRDPQYITEADYVVMESTYGDRLHKPDIDHTIELAKIIQDTFDRGGNVVIPAFAVGRTQELLFYIRKIIDKMLIKGHDGFEVYVDSPLAIEATEIFKNNLLDCFDDETQDLVRRGINPISFDGLKTAVSADDSKNINFIKTPKIIISAAGMCDAGRIRHHLKHNLWRPECTVVFAGYQSVGSLGRLLQDGTENVKLFGESIEVKAHIATLEGISGHADMNGLIKWIRSFTSPLKQVFVVHGDDSVTDSFSKKLRDEYNINAKAPFSGSIYDMITERWINETQGVLIEKSVIEIKKKIGVYVNLVSSGQRLTKIIKDSEGISNKDLSKFTDQINSLCDKWSI